MSSKRGTAIAWYYLMVGGALVIVGWQTRSWWTETLGLAFLAVAAGVLIGGGEWTSWFRGEFDERRKLAADHGFKVAFFVLSWWVGAVAFYAGSHDVSPGLWAAGNAVAIAAAVVDYAVALRRT